MKKENWFNKLLDTYEDDVEFRTEELILDFTERIVAKMEEKGISRAELSRKLGVSKAFITNLLNGNPNLTIKTMVSIADALESRLNLDIYPKGFKPKNFYLFENQKISPEGFTKDVTPVIEEECNARAA
jgi:transcriptional regulator with XRE-family HTH domain